MTLIDALAYTSALTAVALVPWARKRSRGEVAPVWMIRLGTIGYAIGLVLLTLMVAMRAISGTNIALTAFLVLVLMFCYTLLFFAVRPRLRAWMRARRAATEE